MVRHVQGGNQLYRHQGAGTDTCERLAPKISLERKLPRIGNKVACVD